jgi:hypothetical protein
MCRSFHNSVVESTVGPQQRKQYLLSIWFPVVTAKQRFISPRNHVKI